MWFKLFYSFLVGEVKKVKITPEQFKGVIFLLFVSVILLVQVGISRMDSLEEQIKQLPALIEASNKDLKNEMRGYYSDGLEIFESYTTQNSEDLQMIIDYADVNIQNAELIKKMIQRSSKAVQDDAKKKEIDKKMYDTIQPVIMYRKLNSIYDYQHQPRAPKFDFKEVFPLYADKAQMFFLHPY